MKNILRLIFIITMGILLTGLGGCGKEPDPAPPEEPKVEEIGRASCRERV